MKQRHRLLSKETTVFLCAQIGSPLHVSELDYAYLTFSLKKLYTHVSIFSFNSYHRLVLGQT